MKKPKRLGRKTVYESKWVNLYKDKVEFPAGRVIDEHHVLEFDTEAVGVIVRNDKNQLLMVECYRYVTDSIAWEVPAGCIDEGESILEAAAREVLEETSYTTKNHKHLYSYCPSNGNSNQVFHLVSCEAADKIDQDFDRNEVRDVAWFDSSQIGLMLKDNIIVDGFTLSALFIEREFNKDL